MFASATTDINGYFEFNSADDALVAGKYIVEEGSQSGWLQTYPASVYYTIDLGPYGSSLNNDFSNVPLARSRPTRSTAPPTPGWTAGR